LASIILAASATCCCWGRVSAFYFVCELLSKRSVCSRRLSREPLQQRKLYGQNGDANEAWESGS
jgi:hypothetical protein